MASIGCSHAGLHDGELVAAEAATVSVSSTQASSRAATALQQRVADRVAQRVVDVLETVEVEAEHGQALASAVRVSSACSSRSRSSTRLGSSVSAS